ncbi:MAG: hypothetical protein JNG86_20790 [Verrucomicrobiaceae bacterium]|nr:hypothetical protein [Verrucomicrobiaceae bacterium]
MSEGITTPISAAERAGLLAKLPEGKAKETIMRSMTDSHIRKGQFSQALELLNALPDSTGRDRNVFELGQKWATSDMEAATAWLKRQPESTDRDIATAGYAFTLARTDAAGALEWANTIPDAKLRESALKGVAVRWMGSDPAKAEAWMSGVPSFSELDKRMIRDMSKRQSDYFFMPLSVGQRR